jgi:antitoxin component of MazEF toxin-antitoxin module
MKLQKQLSRKIGEKKYPKYVITIPPKQIKALGWKSGEVLEANVEGSRLVVSTKEKGEKNER